MYLDYNGKLKIYASGLAQNKLRLQIVGSAARKVAKRLRLDLEIVRFKTDSASIHVYYESGNEEIPLYSARNGRLDEEEVYKALRNMIFVLSFHPKYSYLKGIRQEIMKLS